MKDSHHLILDDRLRTVFYDYCSYLRHLCISDNLAHQPMRMCCLILTTMRESDCTEIRWLTSGRFLAHLGHQTSASLLVQKRATAVSEKQIEIDGSWKGCKGSHQVFHNNVEVLSKIYCNPENFMK